MKTESGLRGRLRRRAGSVLDWLFDKGKTLPLVRPRIEKNLDAMLAKAPSPLGELGAEIPRFETLPVEGLGPEATLDIVGKLAAREAPRWQSGYVSGAVYHGDPGARGFPEPRLRARVPDQSAPR